MNPPRTFARSRKDGKTMKLQHFQILHHGVGVEKVVEALKAIEYAGIATVQIIFNSPE